MPESGIYRLFCALVPVMGVVHEPSVLIPSAAESVFFCKLKVSFGDKTAWTLTTNRTVLVLFDSEANKGCRR